MKEPMSCAEAEPLLPLVADGAVDPDSDPMLFAHLASCPDCQRIVASHDLIALAIASTPRPAPRASILRLWPWAAAAAAAVLVALGLGLPRQDVTAAPVATAAPVVPAAAPAIVAAPTIAPELLPSVIAVPRGDGTTSYLVQRGEVWVPLDPNELDGPAQPGSGGGSGVQVRY